MVDALDARLVLEGASHAAIPRTQLKLPKIVKMNRPRNEEKVRESYSQMSQMETLFKSRSMMLDGPLNTDWTCWISGQPKSISRYSNGTIWTSLSLDCLTTQLSDSLLRAMNCYHNTYQYLQCRVQIFVRWSQDPERTTDRRGLRG